MFLRKDDAADMVNYFLAFVAVVVVALLCCSCVSRPPRNPLCHSIKHPVIPPKLEAPNVPSDLAPVASITTYY